MMIPIVLEMDEVRDRNVAMIMVWEEIMVMVKEMTIGIADQLGKVYDVAKNKTMNPVLVLGPVQREMVMVMVKASLLLVSSS